MNVKIFKIRLAQEFVQADQEVLNEFMSTVTIKKTAAEMIGNPDHWSVLIFYTNEKPSPAPGSKLFFPADTKLSDEENKIYSALKQWRFDKANEQHLPSYIVSSNTELISIAKVRPKTPQELLQIRGYGGQKITKYGEDIIALLNSVC